MHERNVSLLAEFESAEALKDAAQKVRDQGYRCLDAFTPFPVDGLAEILKLPAPSIPWIGLIGGIAGGLIGLSMQIYVNYDFPINVGGRPQYALTAFAVVMFELTILFSALSMIVAMLWQNGLPRLHHPLFDTRRFHLASKDRFFLCVDGKDSSFHERDTTALLDQLGAHSIERIL
jgi:hypothetical protein